MESVEQRVKILRHEAEVFKQYLTSLPAAAWSQPSACDRWTVADVVSHIGSQGFAETITRGLRGVISPPEGRPPVAEHNEDEFAEGLRQPQLTSKPSSLPDLGFMPWVHRLELQVV